MILSIKKFFSIFSLFFIFIHSSFANDDMQGLPLNEALILALNHPNIVGKQKQYNAAFQKLESSKWLRFPALSVQTSAGQRSTTSSSASVITTVRIEQPLWAGGRISGSIEGNEARLQSSSYALEESEQDLLIKTATAFTSFIKYQEKLKVSRENIKEHQRLLELITRRSRNEISPMSEIILAKSRLDNAKSENIAFQTQMANARSDLENYIGQSFLALKIPTNAISLPNDINDAVSMALSYSPTLKRLESESKAALADMDVAKSVMFPQLAIRSEESYGGVVEGNTTYMALSFTPGNGLSSLSSVREAQNKQEVAENLIKSSKLEIVNKLNSDWNQYKAESSQIEVISNLTETTKGVYESYVRQYAAGRKTWQEVLNSRKENSQANYSLIDSEWNSYMAAFRIQIYTGMLSGSPEAMK